MGIKILTSCIHGDEASSLIIPHDNSFCAAGLHIPNFVCKAAVAPSLNECDPRDVGGCTSDLSAGRHVRALQGLDCDEVQHQSFLWDLWAECSEAVDVGVVGGLN